MTLFASSERISINDDLGLGYCYVWNEPPYNKVFSGIAVNWYPNGVLMIEREYIEGEDIGFEHIWYPTGQIKEDVQAISDYSNWIVRCWHENGQLERYFIRHGWNWKELELKRWDESGKVVEHRVWEGHTPTIPDDTSSLSAVPVAKSLGIPRHLIEQPYGYTTPD